MPSTGLAAPGSAQEVLTLDRAVAMAVEQNQTLTAAGHDLDAARWGKLNAVTNFLPRVAVNAGVTRIDPETELRAKTWAVRYTAAELAEAAAQTHPTEMAPRPPRTSDSRSGRRPFSSPSRPFGSRSIPLAMRSA